MITPEEKSQQNDKGQRIKVTYVLMTSCLMVSLSSLSKKNWFQGLCNQTVYAHVSTHVPARKEILKNITIILGSLRPIYCNRNPETLKQRSRFTIFIYHDVCLFA